MNTSSAEGQTSRRQFLLDRGQVVIFPTEGIDNLTSFLKETGFCGRDQGSMEGFTPQDVMAFEKYLGYKLSHNERKAVLILSANYAIFYNRWNCKPAQDPYTNHLRGKGFEA